MIALMSYLRGEMIKRNSFIEDLDAAVKRAREKEDWKVEYMALSLKFQDAMEEGRAEGRAEGRDEERFSIARNMKQLGIPVDVIVKSTGLTSGEIETL